MNEQLKKEIGNIQMGMKTISLAIVVHTELNRQLNDRVAELETRLSLHEDNAMSRMI